MSWQPIETVPKKEGTRVLLYRHGYLEDMAVCWFNKYGFAEPYWTAVNGSSFLDPTHWMPLPEPPK